MKVKIKKLFKDAVLPKQAKQGDAGIDLTVHRIIKKSLFKIEYGFGVAMELPPNTYADLRPRSSIHKFWMLLSNSCGVADEGYRGEYKAVFYKIPFLSTPYKVGERAIQMILKNYHPVEFIEIDNLSESERGEGGYGSTNK